MTSIRVAQSIATCDGLGDQCNSSTSTIFSTTLVSKVTVWFVISIAGENKVVTCGHVGASVLNPTINPNLTEFHDFDLRRLHHGLLTSFVISHGHVWRMLLKQSNKFRDFHDGPHLPQTYSGHKHQRARSHSKARELCQKGKSWNHLQFCADARCVGETSHCRKHGINRAGLKVTVFQ